MLLTSLTVFGLTGLAAGIILTVAYSKLKVDENVLVEEITEALPGLNCGACGYASCHEYAVALSKEKESANLCRPGGDEAIKKISDILGIETSASSTTAKAVVRCGLTERKKSALYEGENNCFVSSQTGGGMACRYGCLGGGDCVEACPFGAIKLNENDLPVVNFQKCTGCGLCVEACPRDIIKLMEPEEGEIIYVGCMSLQSAKDTKNTCSKGCIGCKICERNAPEGMFEVRESLSYVKKQVPGTSIEDIKCPVDCIYALKRKN